MATVCVASAMALMLAGCAWQAFELPVGTALPGTTMSGRMMGGEQPVTGATVTLYATAVNSSISSGSYVGTATVLGTTTTDSNGDFNFVSSSYTCPANQLAYFVATGGNSGSGATNSSIELAAVIGECGSLQSITNVDELTTVATAYAFSSFISFANGAQTVNITAPANNSSFASSNNVSSGTVTKASGLLHAYQNMLNLVDTVHGVANTAPPSNTAAVAPYTLVNTIGDILVACVNSNGQYPQLAFSTPTTATAGAGSTTTANLLSTSDTLSGTFTVDVDGTTTPVTITSGTTPSAFASQVNTAALGVTASVSGTQITLTGSAGAGNTLAIKGTPLMITTATSSETTCGKLFAATPSAASVSPTNTLQAAVNLARNPYSSPANMTALFGLLPTQVAFNPALAAAPKDWSMAISYPVPANPYTGLGFPFAVALDANDNVYITSPENDPYLPTTTNPFTRTSASACLFGFSSNGTFLPTVTPYSGTPGSGTAGSSSWYCGSGVTGISLLTQLAPDALGNIYVANYGTSTNSTNKLLEFSNAGALTTTFTPSVAPLSVAVDQENDVIFTVNSGSAQNVFGYNSSGTVMSTFTSTADFSQTPRQVVIDKSQNLWFSGYGATSGGTATNNISYGGESEAIAFTGSSSSPTYYATVQKKVIAGGSSSSTTTNSAVFGVALDSNGYAWFTSDAPAVQSSTGTIGLTKQTATGSGSSFALATPGTTITGFTAPKFLEADGNSTLWIADSTGIIAYSTTAPGLLSESGGFNPCLPNGTACSYPDTSSTKNVAVDSTGSVWYTTPDSTTTVANSNRLIQLIGTGTAAWPLLATGQPGVMPQ